MTPEQRPREGERGGAEDDATTEDVAVAVAVAVEVAADPVPGASSSLRNPHGRPGLYAWDGNGGWSPPAVNHLAGEQEAGGRDGVQEEEEERGDGDEYDVDNNYYYAAASVGEGDDDDDTQLGGDAPGGVADDDGSGGDADPSRRWLQASSFQQAARLLQERSQSGAVDGLCLCRRYGGGGGGGGGGNDGNDGDDGDDGLDEDEEVNPAAETLRRAASFALFVRELGKGEVDLRGVTFSFLDWRGLHETDFNLLFGLVLPTHRTLKWITFYDSSIVDRRVPINCLKLFASSIPRTSPLTSLHWSGGHVDQDTAQAIADMIRRDPLHLARLDIRQSGLDSDSLKAICDALPHNTHLLHLHMRAEEVFADSLDGAVAPSSPLRSLGVYMVERLTPEGMAGLAARLKTNTTLECLHLIHLADGWGELLCSGPSIDAEEVFRSVRVVLASCNFTLRELHVPDRPQGRNLSNEAVLAQIFARNSRILRVLEKLEVSSPLSQAPAVGSMAATRLPTPQGYHVEPPGLWPLAMAVTSGVPTPLYRLLRHGAVNHLQARAMPGAKKRNRPSIDEVELEG